MNLESKNDKKENVYFIENIITTSNNKKNIFLENNFKDDNFTITSIEEALKKSKKNIWKLEIPKIELSANIAEGTTEKILDEYIGHFEETQKQNGNIGLAAHNRGYKVNYFNRLKELEIGDEIIYTCFGVSKIYKVIQKNIIEDTNWNVLKNTKENILTLITCVENEPSKRLCVQAISYDNSSNRFIGKSFIKNLNILYKESFV